MYRTSYSNQSYGRIVLLSFLVGLFTIGVSLAVDWALHGRGLVETWVIFGSVRHLYASDVLAAVAAFVASAVALARMQARQRELVERMQAVEDVNHHVRNALTAVMLSSILYSDPELSERVRDASERIDWVLREVLPATLTGADSSKTGKWSAGRKLGKAS